MTDLDDGRGSPKLGQGLFSDGERFSTLAEHPLLKRLSRNKVFKKLPPWGWGGLALGGLFGVIWLLNGRIAPPPAQAPAAVGGNTTELAVDILVKLSLIVGLIYGGLYVFRRWRGADLRSGAKKIDVLETVHLSPRRAIHLVRAGERVILIGATDQNVTFLSDIENPSFAPAQHPSLEFAEVLARENVVENLNSTAKNENSTALIENSTAKNGNSTAKIENSTAKNEFSSAINGQGGLRDRVFSETAGSTDG